MSTPISYPLRRPGSGPRRTDAHGRRLRRFRLPAPLWFLILLAVSVLLAWLVMHALGH